MAATEIDNNPELVEMLIGRRKVPRRLYESSVGVLARGKFTIERCFQVGEGGMMFSSTLPLVENNQIVISFYLPASGMIIVRGVVRSVIAASKKLPERYGLEFLNIGFHHKREIRNFVAAATRQEGYTGL